MRVSVHVVNPPRSLRQDDVVPDEYLQRDLGVARRWWEAVATTAPANVVGLWFGMTDLSTATGVARHLYVAGCSLFDAADDSAEWATDYCWWPDDRYVLLPDLAAIPDSAYLDALTHATALVGALRPQDTLGVKGVAVGFDDGDFKVVWTS
jgi:hypothetical protein